MKVEGGGAADDEPRRAGVSPASPLSSEPNCSLQDLDGEIWGEPDYPSDVVTRCHHLRTIPLRDLTVDDFRLLISQEIGLRYLVPLPLALLEENPIAEGDHYPGDLLHAMTRIPGSFWEASRDEYRRVTATAQRALDALRCDHSDVADELLRAFGGFVQGGSA